MKYAIRAAYPGSGESYAVVYHPWPWPAKTRCSVGWTSSLFDAAQFDTREEAEPFLEEIRKGLQSPASAAIVGV